MRAEIWLVRAGGGKCNECKPLPICRGNEFPWYRIKYNEPRCITLKDKMKDVIEILELQDSIDAEIT